MKSTKKYVVSVLTLDQVGLLADITKAIFELKGNIGNIRQSIVNEYFSLVFISQHPTTQSPEIIQAKINSVLENPLSVVVSRSQAPSAAKEDNHNRYIVMTNGPDNLGTVHAIASFMVEYGVNIEDWIVETTEDNVIYIAQVLIPKTVITADIQQAFKEKMSKIGLMGTICHENIFRATNEIGPIKALLDNQK